MEVLKSNVLVISYYFPPYKRVGGRRWAKHVKYMNRFDVNTYVLAAEFLNSISSWDDDLVEYKDKITRVPLEPNKIKYFKRIFPKNIIEKVRWKLSLYFSNIQKHFFHGNHKDQSIKSIDDFFFKSTALIKEKNIKTVILSVGPFRYSEILIKLKLDHPHVKCVIDYRDRWEDGFAGLTKKQKRLESEIQKKVLDHVDLALTVNDSISGKISTLKPDLKVMTLPHCVDDDFFNCFNVEKKIRGNSLKFIYGGELYKGLDKEIQLFVDFFSEFNKKNNNNCVSEFYLTYPAYQNILATNSDIHLYGLLDKIEYQNKLNEADFVLLFRPGWSLDAMSSKFYELLCLRKPILYFGKQGKVSEFIVQHKLGFHIGLEDDILVKLKPILNNIKESSIPDQSYDLSKHTFEYHTKKLIEVIEQLHSLV